MELTRNNDYTNFKYLYIHHSVFRLKRIFLFGIFLIPLFISGQRSLFIENKGQWDSRVLFRAEIPGGELFLEKTGLTYHFWDEEKRSELIEKMHHREGESVKDGVVQSHVVRVSFIGSQDDPAVIKEKPSTHYYNYFLGNDVSRWATNVHAYSCITYSSVYPGIDFKIYNSEGGLKYDFIVHPGADHTKIKLRYDGQDEIKSEQGELNVMHSTGKIIEKKPESFLKSSATKTPVRSEYVLKKNIVSFKVSDNSSSNDTLIIDPALIFSTYSGSQSDNWGFTATYDSQGNMYGGGIVLAANAYPNVTGSYQQIYGGGIYDILIGKYNSSGSTLLYYTYLGGSAAEAPFSLVCNENDDLYILGITGSGNFSVTPGAYQTVFKGGPSAGVFALNGNDYPNGSDIFVSKLNAAGNILIGSTFIGGTNNDGLNTGSTLKHNYADEFRGEIIVDANDQCYIASSTQSSNFPVVGANQINFGGAQDAVIFKLNGGLNNLLWSTYNGGAGFEAGYSLKLNDAGDLYVTGGTNSPNFLTTPGVIQQNFSGGTEGFITRYSAGGALLNSTFLGTAGYDQSYILQLDDAGNVYSVGQTTGSYPVINGPTGSVYSNPNSGQFIHKLNPTLTQTIFSTVFGRGVPGQVDIVPTAFLVDVCNHIYVSGWGGNVNQGFGGGSTTGLPVTPNAYQPSTTGSDFYFIVLDENATGLIYASFFGGGVSAEHVDGGTSRFDPDGIVYQAVCAGCGSYDDFPTTPGAWSNTNNSNNCNMGVFKFDVSDFTAIIDPVTPTVTCINNTIILQNNSTGGSNFYWDLGDGNISTSPTVNHTYLSPGTYNVLLIVSDPQSCVLADTASLTIVVEGAPVAMIDPVTPICPGESVTLQASGGNNYLWQASPSLSALGIPSPLANPAQSTQYIVTVSNNCGSDTASVFVNVVDFNPAVNSSDTICIGNTIQLSAQGGVSYSWSPAGGLNDANLPNPIASPTSNATYTVTITDADGCSAALNTTIVVENPPQANAGADQTICFGESAQLIATGGSAFVWSPPLFLNNTTIPNPVSSPLQTTQYIVSANNSCGGDLDSVWVYVIRIDPASSPDTIICPGTAVQLWSTGGVYYLWEPAIGLSSTSTDTVMATPMTSTLYTVLVTDTNGCSETDSVFVTLFPSQSINLANAIDIPFGGNATLYASGEGTFIWSPDSFLTCNNCNQPIASPFTSTQYFVTLTDANGCAFYDSIWVFVEGSLYVPNTFTPNMDGMNELFLAQGVEIDHFEMWIFNRWGEEIFKSDNLNVGWDGTHRGLKSPVGVYAWKIYYTELSGKEGLLIGHVTLLR